MCKALPLLDYPRQRSPTGWCLVFAAEAIAQLVVSRTDISRQDPGTILALREEIADLKPLVQR